MIGYLIFASANLLGYTGGYVVYTALQVYNVILDWPTFVFVMFNFAGAGVVAVFWQKVRVCSAGLPCFFQAVDVARVEHLTAFPALCPRLPSLSLSFSLTLSLTHSLFMSVCLSVSLSSCVCQGVPRLATQGYLVCVSVIMAWIVTKLPEVPYLWLLHEAIR
jgi:hypothetical protein